MRRLLVAGSALALLPLAACSPTPGGADDGVRLLGETGTVRVAGAVGDGGDLPDADDPAYDAALSTPRTDPVYPVVGDPGLDALHYDLDLGWDPDARLLTGHETLVLRATGDADRLVLDLSDALTVTAAALDGTQLPEDAVQHADDDLVLAVDVVADQRYVLELDYEGTPLPVAAPTTRSDFSTNGWTTGEDGSTWTMQEPYGALTWYAVDDQPADKAFYDISVAVPDGWTSVANGTVADDVVDAGVRTTDWHLDAPAASYLVTVATGDHVRTDLSAGDVPVTTWVPTSSSRGVAVAAAPGALRWVEGRLGRYPFESLGVLVVGSESGMETQTMLTLGDTEYATSPAVLVHEIVHQWYGDLVTPTDWRDLWMNEGMAMYLQAIFQAENSDYTLEQLMAYWYDQDAALRRSYGPPAEARPESFGESNVYLSPAVMWHLLRGRIGDETFWRLVRAWPRTHADGNAGTDAMVRWWSRRSGVPTSFFDAWLRGERTPPYA
ncbi:M1 family metallopeptidase [Nocardioides bruguierae]|uniref:Aminopeptidase N n=1 Tax=Nocardioides bruguierae TaxID=2945102 RepID=A0A9X2D6N8_9ACTN|nr:M1 family metallopeptidase [Nocardioides bruguierae]MCM0620306.1 M1 family metallopeptidase [Nocardioides bruguierae]